MAAGAVHSHTQVSLPSRLNWTVLASRDLEGATARKKQLPVHIACLDTPAVRCQGNDFKP
jgi:hypothetical protein